MSTAVRAEINRLVADAQKLALETCLKPKSEREYLLACGKVQQMRADARALQDRFFAPEPQQDPEVDLDPPDPEPRRVAPQRDRVDAARDRHRPRSM